VDRETLLGSVIDAPWSDEDPDREFRIAVEMPLTQLLAEYQAVCARHGNLLASLDLDTPSKGVLNSRTEPVTLRWILFHLIEETARQPGDPAGGARRAHRAPPAVMPDASPLMLPARQGS
jgi:hypothetical protein